ncbi:MAG: HAD family phosphatase [Candidatus Daviesbacteria bacterium]|nr:HAD family phosphatase [Candidatus Daviesbacteria bacterium]
MNKIKAVLFDMDGLMVDTEPIHLRAFNYALGKYGKHLTEEGNTRRYIGTPDIDGAKDMVLRFSLPISAQELVMVKKARVKELLTSLEPEPGLIELLANLKQNDYKVAIASSSYLETIRKIIQDLGVAKMIDKLASAEEVKQGKPAPDVYLLAAEKLGVSPSECLVLEDAPKGVQAGKLAGMKVFAIPSQYTKDGDFSLADKVLSSLSEVFDLINL